MRYLLLVLFASMMLAGCLPNLGGGEGAKATGEFTSGQVVKGFPSLPLYPKAKIVESYGLDEKYGASFITDDDLVKVVNFYGNAFKELGWESALRQISETNFQYDIKNALRLGTVIVNTAADGKKTAITISTEPR